MTKDEAMKLALEALEYDTRPATEYGINTAITILKQALEQPELEPVAWTLLLVGENTGIIGKAGETFESHPKYYKRVDVYTSPLKHEPPCKTGSQCTTKCMECAEQKPVAVVSGYYGGKCVVLPTDPARIFNSGTAFYTHPQGNRQSHRSRTRH